MALKSSQNEKKTREIHLMYTHTHTHTIYRCLYVYGFLAKGETNYVN